MVYDSAKWDNITLAFFLVDHFPRVIAFVLFHFEVCHFLVTILKQEKIYIALGYVFSVLNYTLLVRSLITDSFFCFEWNILEENVFLFIEV